MAASELLFRALGPEADDTADAVSGEILDAALSLAAESGIDNLTMDGIARRAGVGRMTVYRRFGDKRRLLGALASREGARCLAELDAAADPSAPIEDQLAAGFVTSLRIAREHPLLSRLARVEPEAVLRALTEDDGAVFAMARAFLASRLRQSQRAAVISEVDVEEISEILVRLCFSFVLIEESSLPLDDPERLDETARRLLTPLLTQGPG